MVSALALIALLGAYQQAASAIRGNLVADQRSVATALAQSKIEDLERLRFADLASGADGTTLNASGGTGGLYSRSWQVSSETINGVPARRISVTVSWQVHGAAATTSLTTRIVDVPDYGPGFPTVVVHGWRRQ